MKEAHTDVHFYPDNTASCIVNVASSGEEGIADTLLLWACFANRQLNNMGKDAPSLARALTHVNRFEAFLTDQEGPRLLDACPGRAKARFEGHLVPVGERFAFKLVIKGLSIFGVFSIFGKGLHFYGAISVVLFLQHLARANREVPRFLESLEHLAEITGKAFMLGEVNMRNGNEQAFINVLAALSETVPSLDGWT